MNFFKGKTEKTLFWTGIALFIIVFAVIVISRSISYDIYVTVTPAKNIYELNFDSRHINFGTVSPGFIAQKYIDLTNDSKLTSIFYIKIKGELAPWVKTDSRLFMIKPESSKKLQVNLSIPKIVKFGTYKGKIILYNFYTIF